MVNYKNIHNFFKLNGQHFDRNGLCIAAANLIKEGEPYEKEIGVFLLEWFDDKAYIELHTSGTTGTPKKIRKQKQQLVNSALATGDFFNLKPGDTALLCLPVQYIAGKMMLVRSFILGLQLDYVVPSACPLEHIQKEYDFVAMVPLQVENSLDYLDGIKKLIIGGAAVNKSLSFKLQGVKTAVYETYGMTETITHIAARRVGETYFTVLPNVVISATADNCLVVDASAVADEPVITNDLVELGNKGQFCLLGRIDNVVNSGGIKLIPEQLEEKLSKSISKRFLVGGIPDEKLGQKLVLLIEGVEEPLDDNIFDVLEKYEKPKAVYFIPKFPETESGKLKRKEILKLI